MPWVKDENTGLTGFWPDADTETVERDGVTYYKIVAPEPFEDAGRVLLMRKDGMQGPADARAD